MVCGTSHGRHMALRSNTRPLRLLTNLPDDPRRRCPAGTSDCWGAASTRRSARRALTIRATSG